MIVLKDFNLIDLLLVCAAQPPDERELWTAMTGEKFDADQVASLFFQLGGMNWIFATEAGVPVAAGGLTRQRPGVFRTWFFAMPVAWEQHGAPLTAAVKDIIQQALSSDLAHRIETATLADRSRARNWYSRIGLQLESTLRGYAINGEDAVMYVATRDGERG